MALSAQSVRSSRPPRLAKTSALLAELPHVAAGVVCVKFSKREIRQELGKGAVAFPLGGLQELKLFGLLAKHFHVQVTVSFDPVLVDFDRQSSDQAQGALLIGISWLSRSSNSEGQSR
jgi:hypothetical protein